MVNGINKLKINQESILHYKNSEDPDHDMPHKAAIHLGLHCLLRQNHSSEKGIQ